MLCSILVKQSQGAAIVLSSQVNFISRAHLKNTRVDQSAAQHTIWLLERLYYTLWNFKLGHSPLLIRQGPSHLFYFQNICNDLHVSL